MRAVAFASKSDESAPRSTNKKPPPSNRRGFFVDRLSKACFIRPMGKKFQYVVYKITFPNGKIYIGKDVGTDGHTIRYFGTWNYARVERDFTKDQLADVTIRREILFESSDKVEVGRMEMELIVEHGANDPTFGYNAVPKFRPSFNFPHTSMTSKGSARDHRNRSPGAIATQGSARS